MDHNCNSLASGRIRWRAERILWHKKLPAEAMPSTTRHSKPRSVNPFCLRQTTDTKVGGHSRLFAGLALRL
jgi:hypothetical protein